MHQRLWIAGQIESHRTVRDFRLSRRMEPWGWILEDMELATCFRPRRLVKDFRARRMHRDRVIFRRVMLFDRHIGHKSPRVPGLCRTRAESIFTGNVACRSALVEIARVMCKTSYQFGQMTLPMLARGC